MTSIGAQSSANNGQSKPLVLNEGQMVHGQIKQLFPGQTAEIQLGNQKMIAKLETPMKAGDSYYFQVSAVKPELQLKIISGPTGVTEGQAHQLNRLMEAMQLPKTDEMKELLSFVIKNKMPMTREGLLQAESLLRNVPASLRAEALQAIHKMTELKLPFIESTFRSILGVESKEGLHSITATFKGVLLNDSSVTPQTRAAIVTILDNMTKPFARATENAVLGQSILTLLDSSQSADTRFATVQLLKNAGIFPAQTSLANLPQILASLLTTETTPDGNRMPTVSQIQPTVVPSTPLSQLEGLKALITAQTGLSAQQKESLLSMVNRMISSPSAGDAANKLVQELSQAILRMSAENAVIDPFRGGSGSKNQLMMLLGKVGQPEAVGNLASLLRVVENSDNQAIQKIVQSAEAAVAAAAEGKVMKDAIQTIFRSLGVNYESMLLGKDTDIGRLAQSLKPQLLALIQDPSVSAAVRESAEQFVIRMNGPLLTSGENGVQHQLVMQVPLEFFGKRIDATLQWSGRMKDDGKIDADFARILFYLDLHSLNKTVIDMQVQDRVVTVTIFNADRTLQTIGKPIQDKLKLGLESVGYKLSGVFFKEFVEEPKEMENLVKEVVIESQGVDFRI